MSKEYVAYVRDPKKMQEGAELLLVIRDLTPGPRKYDARVVKAVVSNSPGASGATDTLYLRSATGIADPRPRGIQILKEVGNSLPGPPYSDVLALQK